MADQKFRFHCLECDKRVSVPSQSGGKRCICPRCGTILTIPNPAQASHGSGRDIRPTGRSAVPVSKTAPQEPLTTNIVNVAAIIAAGVAGFILLMLFVIVGLPMLESSSGNGSGGSSHTGGTVIYYRRCTCGCTHSETMIAELRQQDTTAALMAVEESLAEIAERQQHGLATKEMLVHRGRLLHLAKQLQGGKAQEQSRLAAGDPPQGSNLLD